NVFPAEPPSSVAGWSARTSCTKEADMNQNVHKDLVTKDELAHIGEGVVAYLREFDSTDLKQKFPGMPEVEPGTKLWAVFAADGRPILLADERASALAGAMQNDLTPVSVH